MEYKRWDTIKVDIAWTIRTWTIEWKTKKGYIFIYPEGWTVILESEIIEKIES